jgi:hypothetical protein
LLFEGGLGLAADIRSQHPDSLLFGRFWLDQETSILLSAGALGANEVADRCLNHPANAHVNGWQSLNEAFTGGAVRSRQVATFDGAFADSLAQANRWALVGNIAVGNPPNDGDIRYLAPTLKHPNAILNYHAYAHRDHPNTEYTVFRYRRWWAPLAAEGVYNPRIILGEIGHEPGGWRLLGLSADQYVYGMQFWASKWWQDGVGGSAIFTMRDNNGWPYFDIMGAPALIAGLGAYNREHAWRTPIAMYPSQQEEETMPTAHTIYDNWARRFADGFNPLTSIGLAWQAAKDWGVPISTEQRPSIDGQDFVVQEFSMGIAVVRFGDWDNVVFCRTEAEVQAALHPR